MLREMDFDIPELPRRLQAPRERFADWLSNKAQQSVIMSELAPFDGDLDAYVEANGTPDKVVSSPRIKILSYPGKFVAHDLQTGQVLVFDGVYLPEAAEDY